MKNFNLRGMALGAAVALTAAGCAAVGDQNVVTGPQLDIVGGSDKQHIEVCKIGPAGSTANFSVTHTGTGTLPSGATFTLPAGTDCVAGVNSTVAWEIGGLSDPADVITITETGSSPGTYLYRIYTEGGLDGPQDLQNGETSITVRADATTSFGIAFKNEGTPPPQFCSYTPGGWGAPPNGGNIAVTLHANFATLYPTGVSVGSPRYARFTSASAVTTYLPSGGTPGVLTSNLTNPTTKTSAGEFLDQVLALRFNVDFSNAGIITNGFGGAVVQSGALAGLTTTQVLSLVNAALGGNTAPLAAYGVTVKAATTILSAINGSMDNCTTNTFFTR